METGEPTEKAGKQTNVVALPKSAEPVAPHQKAAAFVREHPVMTIAGGLAIGAVAAALIPRRNRAYVAKQGSVLADAIAAASATVAQQALSSLDTASTSVRKGAHSIASRAEQAGEVAYDKAQSLLGRKPAAPTIGERIVASAGDLAERLRR
jgi:ElaB/YqjD/DUF883 family membrane-anchored ribosome-binding protein